MRKYFIDYENVSKEDFEQQLEGDLWIYSNNNFDDYLDEISDKINVFGMDYAPSFILKLVDHQKYSKMLDEYCNELISNAILELMKYNDYTSPNNVVFEIKESE